MKIVHISERIVNKHKANTVADMSRGAVVKVLCKHIRDPEGMKTAVQHLLNRHDLDRSLTEHYLRYVMQDLAVTPQFSDILKALYHSGLKFDEQILFKAIMGSNSDLIYFIIAVQPNLISSLVDQLKKEHEEEYAIHRATRSGRRKLR